MNSLKVVLIFCVAMILLSCSVSKTYPKEYYAQHKTTMEEMELLYANITKEKLIAVAFYDLEFNDISLEFKTDTVRYIYDFNYDEKRMNDSLFKFGYDTTLVQRLIKNMRTIGCSWINTLDYYVDGNKRLLLFMSSPVKQITLVPFLRKRKYYLFNFYAQPQYYDEQGLLLDKRTVRRIRKVSGEVFRRITDKVCYTVSGKFR